MLPSCNKTCPTYVLPIPACIPRRCLAWLLGSLKFVLKPHPPFKSFDTAAVAVRSSSRIPSARVFSGIQPAAAAAAGAAAAAAEGVSLTASRASILHSSVVSLVIHRLPRQAVSRHHGTAQSCHTGMGALLPMSHPPSAFFVCICPRPKSFLCLLQSLLSWSLLLFCCLFSGVGTRSGYRLSIAARVIFSFRFISPTETH